MGSMKGDELALALRGGEHADIWVYMGGGAWEELVVRELTLDLEATNDAPSCVLKSRATLVPLCSRSESPKGAGGNAGFDPEGPGQG